MVQDGPRDQFEGLRFFGKISASISHDIKNVLAVINENAGLLEDLAQMAESGRPLDPLRVKTVAAKIAAQVGRADAIVKDMNRFAHSVDHPSRQVMMADALVLLLALYRRTAAMRNVTVSLDDAQDPGSLHTSPFDLLRSLWGCLDHVAEAAGSGGSVGIRAERATGSVNVRYRMTTETGAQAPPATAVGEDINRVAAFLGGKITMDSEDGRLDLVLPSDDH